MTSTIDYYNKNAKAFSDNTRDVSFTDTQDRFMSLLLSGASILDFGCGSGRDTKVFLDKGFRVDAIDGSEELCRLASDYTGTSVKHMYFEEFCEYNKYDGIWACASILHLERSKLSNVMSRLERAVRPGGFIYASFKYGIYEGMRNDRYFTDFTEESFTVFLDDLRQKDICPETDIIDMRTTKDVRPGRSEEIWINVILQRLKRR